MSTKSGTNQIPRLGLRDAPQQRHRQGAHPHGFLRQAAAVDPQRVRRVRRRSGVYPQNLQRQEPHLLVLRLRGLPQHGAHARGLSRCRPRPCATAISAGWWTRRAGSTASTIPGPPTPTTWARQPFSYNGQLNVIDSDPYQPVRQVPVQRHAACRPCRTSTRWKMPTSMARSPIPAARLDSQHPHRPPLFRQRQLLRPLFAGQLQPVQRVLHVRLARTAWAARSRRLAPNKSLASSWVHTFSPSFFNELTGERLAERRGIRAPAGPDVVYNDQLGAAESEQNARLAGHLLAWAWIGISKPRTRSRRRSPSTSSTTTPRRSWGGTSFNSASTTAGTSWTRCPSSSTRRARPSETASSPRCTTQTRRAPSRCRTAYAGHALGSTYLGLINYYVQLGHPLFQMRAKEYALYFQDNFKVTPRLTLNLGLRYDYWPPVQRD